MSGEETLNKLFEQARNEAAETNVNDIRKWIGLVTIGTILISLLTKMKLVFTKSAIIYTSAILTTGIGLGSYFFTTDNRSAQQQYTPVDKTDVKVESFREEPDEKTIIFTSPQKIIHQNDPPIQELITEDNAEIPVELPPVNESFRKEIPQNIAPISISDNEEDYGTFKALKLSGTVDVVITQGAKESVRIEADEKGKSVLIIKNKNGTLEIYTENKRNISNYKLKIYVTVVDLNKIESSGATDLKSRGELTFNNLELKGSGASDIDLKLNVKELNLGISGSSDVNIKLSATELVLNVSGASDVELSGNTTVADLICSGASNLDASGLKVKSGVIKCSGASSTKIYVTDKLDLTVSGASDVKYKGNPSIGIKSVTGASKVRQF